MKKILFIAFMQILLGTLLIGIANSCQSDEQIKEQRIHRTVNGVYYSDYTRYTVAHLNSLKSPVILVGKTNNTHYYTVTIIDSTRNITVYNSNSDLTESIRINYKIGDTIR